MTAAAFTRHGLHPPRGATGPWRVKLASVEPTFTRHRGSPAGRVVTGESRLSRAKSFTRHKPTPLRGDTRRGGVAGGHRLPRRSE